jgi:hypothetical protein
MPEAEAPPGTHLIRLEVKDSQGPDRDSVDQARPGAVARPIEA